MSEQLVFQYLGWWRRKCVVTPHSPFEVTQAAGMVGQVSPRFPKLGRGRGPWLSSVTRISYRVMQGYRLLAPSQWRILEGGTMRSWVDDKNMNNSREELNTYTVCNITVVIDVLASR